MRTIALPSRKHVFCKLTNTCKLSFLIRKNKEQSNSCCIDFQTVFISCPHLFGFDVCIAFCIDFGCKMVSKMINLGHPFDDFLVILFEIVYWWTLWCILVVFWFPFGSLLATFGALLAPFGVLWVPFGSICIPFWFPLVPFGFLFVNRQSPIRKKSKNMYEEITNGWSNTPVVQKLGDPEMQNWGNIRWHILFRRSAASRSCVSHPGFQIMATYFFLQGSRRWDYPSRLSLSLSLSG